MRSQDDLAEGNDYVKVRFKIVLVFRESCPAWNLFEHSYRPAWKLFSAFSVRSRRLKSLSLSLPLEVPPTLWITKTGVVFPQGFFPTFAAGLLCAARGGGPCGSFGGLVAAGASAGIQVTSKQADITALQWLRRAGKHQT